MPRSSESVAALASSLAKAQAELINPEKSLTATIRTGRAGEGERSFRYAPLSSGLDIVRKTLGQHEIATLQTTEIDQTAGMVRLTTMLAHASGEWIASEWPVCPIAETANPPRMGAALTHARRYALFTLVGIAGEDDLDGPDLCDEPLSSSTVDRSLRPTDDQSRMSPRTPSDGHVRGVRAKLEPVLTLNPDQSAALREKLLMELGYITSADLAASWARATLALKNSLTAADAKLVEDAFERRLSEFPSSGAATPSNDGPRVPPIARPQVIATTESTDAGQVSGIDKSILTVAAPRRYRNREHLRYVAQQACLVCGRKPSDPHHLSFTQPRALGRKVSDEFAVPLCRGHHRAVHRSRDECTWWRQVGMDPLKVARRLWKQTRGMGQQRPERPVSPRPHATAASPDPKNKEIDATNAARRTALAVRSRLAGPAQLDTQGSPMTRWGSTRPAEEDVSDLPGIDLQSKRRRSRRRAWRDGLADQTVVSSLEDVRSYRAFERTLVGGVDPRSVIELALIHRLASLLWRLHRAIAIETGLFELQVEALPARRQDPSRGPRQPGTPPTQANGHSKVHVRDDPPIADHDNSLSTTMRPPLGPWSKSRTIAQCFLRLSNLDPTLLDRVGSYEARLWCQAAQTIWTLETMRQPPSPIRQRLRHRVAPFTWDRER